MIFVFTNGCFEILHQGHSHLLQDCAFLAGKEGTITIGLNSDRWMLLNKKHPAKSQSVRSQNLLQLACQFHKNIKIKLIENEPDIIENLNNLVHRAHGRKVYLVKGMDYKPQEINGYGLLGVTLALVPLVTGKDNYKLSSSKGNH